MRSPTGPDWVAWRRQEKTEQVLQAIRDSIEDAKNIWATDGYSGSFESDAKARGNVFTLQMIEAWLNGIKVEEEGAQDGEHVGDTPNG
jgi:hypothetical protein